MFEVKKQECVLKGIDNVESGTFTTSDGKVLAYDGYTRVTVCLKDKNNKYIDTNLRIPNSTEGQLLTKKLSEVGLMSKIYVDVEIQLSKSAPKIFLTNFSVLK